MHINGGNRNKSTRIGSDATTKTRTFSLSFSFPSSIKVEFKSCNSCNGFECSNDIDKRRMKWKYDTAITRISSNAAIGSNEKISNQTTFTMALPSPKRNDAYGNVYNGNTETDDESQNDESFSSFLSSSIGSNISKSFDWALETSTTHSCQNPFGFYCVPIKSNPIARKQIVITRHQRDHKEEDDDDEVQPTPASDSEEGVLHPYVPFSLPSFCEYCGSPSIQNCREFDPECQRPKTFFPKANPPFGRSTMHSPF